jgi:hypothetical protein
MNEDKYRVAIGAEVAAHLMAWRGRHPERWAAVHEELECNRMRLLRIAGGREVPSEALARRICALVGVEWVDVVEVAVKRSRG